MRPVGWRLWAALPLPRSPGGPDGASGGGHSSGASRRSFRELDRLGGNEKPVNDHDIRVPGTFHSPADYGVTPGFSFGTKPKEANSAWPSSPRRKSANVLAAAGFSVRETMPRYCTTGS